MTSEDRHDLKFLLLLAVAALIAGAAGYVRTKHPEIIAEGGSFLERYDQWFGN